ncbi:hypothetical protein I4U23_024200 [Adineta vaga]|nr:hypothetical protein I4U23_024200 [Adineta vaga]
MAKMHNFDEIKHKRFAPERHNSSSYRIFGEEASEQENSQFRQTQSRQPAPFYTELNAYSSSAPAPDLRQNPYATRPIENNRSNASSSGPMRGAHGEREESRWWDWSQSKTNPSGSGTRNQDERAKTRDNSYQNLFQHGTDERTTYSRQNSRYSANPKHMRTVGIVPITGLKSDDMESVDQRHIERIPYEQQQYVTQTQLDYARRDQQYDASVNEPSHKPPTKPNDRTRTTATTAAKVERAGSMWDLFHHYNGNQEQMPLNSRKYQRPLPEIKRTESYDSVWSNPAPYVSDYHMNRDFNQPPMVNQMNVD